MAYLKNVAGQNIGFVQVAIATGLGVAGATVTVYVNKDNGGQNAGTGTVTNNGNGQYNYAPVQAETNCTEASFAFVSTGCFLVEKTVIFEVAPLLTSGTGANQIQVDGSGNAYANVAKINLVSAASVTTINANIGTTQVLSFNANNFLKVSLNDILATTLTETSGQLAGGFKQWFNVTTPTGTVNSVPNAVAGTNGGLFIAGTNASTTVTTAFTTTFTGNLTGSVGSVTGAVGSVTGAVGSVTGNVGGNVTGSVGSVAGNVSGSVASVVGNIGGNVVGSVGSVTGNVGGNVVGSVASVTAAVTLTTSDSPVLQTGTATAGSATTITIQTALGTTADPVGCKVKITSGTGAKQERVITGYVNSTLVVTVDYAWVTNPDATSVYAILYDNAPVLNSSLAVTATGSGTFTANVTQWNGTNVSIPATAGIPDINVKNWNNHGALSDANNLPKVDVEDFGGTAGTFNTGIPTVSYNNTTALSNVQWTNALATSLTTLAGHDPGATLGTSTLTQTQVTGGAYSVQSASCVLGDARIANLDTNVNSRAPSATALSTINWTTTRAGYLDNLNVGGPVANSASLATVNNNVLAIPTNPLTSLGATSPIGWIDTASFASGTTLPVVTNLTNAPTIGDFTATMKTSLNSATPASVTGAVGSVTGNVGGNVTGSVGSIASGGITDASFTVPGETTGRPTGMLSIIRRTWEWIANQRQRDRSTGNVTLNNAANNAVLETQVQSTSGTVDTGTQGH